MSTKVDVEKFIKRQVAEWETRQRQWQHEPPLGHGSQAGLAYGPYLLLSREMGAGAHEVAQIVSGKLGWQVCDREIVDEIAHDAHVRNQLIDSLDERDRAAMEEIIFSMFGEPMISTENYMAHLHRTVHALALRGDVVIVGRGARFILPAQSGLNVRLIAPLETRVQRVAARERIQPKEARQKIEQVDLARTKFIRHHFNQDVSDPLGYELTINTGSLTADMAAEIILRALEQKPGVHSRSQT